MYPLVCWNLLTLVQGNEQRDTNQCVQACIPGCSGWARGETSAIQTQSRGIKIGQRAGKMVQWTKVLAIKPDCLNSVSRAHIAEGENQLL